MNDITHTAWTEYIRLLADRLLLRDWHFVVSRTEADAGNRAQVGIHHKKDEAEVFLSEAWLAYPPEQQRQTLTHELLHAHLGRLCRVMTRLKEQDDREVVRYANTAFDEEEEIVVETLARILAPMLPLPRGEGST